MADSWEALKQDCAHCRGCALADTRTNVVFGDGAETAEIMLIGEGPGQHEDEQGVPFVGRAGQLLDDMLEIIHLDRTKVYIANVVKCRPPQNRDPLNVEQDACIGYLRRQAALVKPKIIVCLGRIAAKAIIKEDFKITQEHGQWFQRGGVQMTANAQHACRVALIDHHQRIVFLGQLADLVQRSESFPVFHQTNGLPIDFYIINSADPFRFQIGRAHV